MVISELPGEEAIVAVSQHLGDLCDIQSCLREEFAGALDSGGDAVLTKCSTGLGVEQPRECVGGQFRGGGSLGQCRTPAEPGAEQVDHYPHPGVHRGPQGTLRPSRLDVHLHQQRCEVC